VPAPAGRCTAIAARRTRKIVHRLRAGRKTWRCRRALRSAVEMLSVGVLAGGAAYLVGRVASALVR
jgi:hypothetical protein